ncbi:hypothetical protein FB45DRAFT_1044558 [Roridomyces roridus]|uniref:Uncharacterized protein n=1 Tax=Roridomyces roridus TaxID=1738132 RepID=A0AAD7F5X4_9AGAR|nr:hypothetical protein FB45DRAFT_1044558 [Roridomyces roridus]
MPDCSFCCESFQGSKAGLTNHLKRCAAAAEEHLEALRDIAAEEQAANDAVAAREAEELAATARAQSSPPMDIDEPPAVSYPVDPLVPFFLDLTIVLAVAQLESYLAVFKMQHRAKLE